MPNTYLLPPGSRVLITGATGFSGAWLIQKLLKQSLEITAIARISSDLTPFRGMPIRWIKGDVFDPDLIKQAMKSIHYVFHLATPFREAKAADNIYHKVHVDSTRLMVECALAQPEFKRFILVSTIGVHGHVESPPIDETGPINHGDLYQQSKWAAEMFLNQFAQANDFPVTIVRPSSIYGPGDKRLLIIYKWVAHKWIPVIGNGSNLLHFIHVDDFTDFLIHAATHPAADGETFICGSPSAMTFSQLLNLIAEQYNTKIYLLKFPKRLTFLVGDIIEGFCKPLGIEPPIYRRRLAFYTKDRSFNTQKMTQLLGFETKHTDQQGIADLTQWYLDNGWVKIS